MSLYGHPFMLQCCRTDSPRTLRSLIQPIAGAARGAWLAMCSLSLYFFSGSSIRLRRLDPSLRPLSFDSVSQISTSSAFNGDAGVEWLGLERMAEGGQPEGRVASEVMVAAEAAAAAAPMSARVMQQEQQQVAAAPRLPHDVPSLPLSARGAGVAGAAVQQQPLSARARVPVALNRGGGSRNTDVVPDDDAANPQPAASRLQEQQQHPRLNVVLTSSQAGAPRPVPALDMAGLNARIMAAAASSAAAGGVGDAGAGAVSSRGNQALSGQAAAGPVSARGARADAAPNSARGEAAAVGAAQRDAKRDVVTASNISELRSKVLTCQEEVQRMKEYAVELERDNASLKQVCSAARRSSCSCSCALTRPVSNSPLSPRSVISCLAGGWGS